ncbi:MAG TPA: Hpt domain-containing protein [Gammaproteobacteria bacterium]
MNTSIPVFDKELALQRAGGNQELAEELLGMLLRELPATRQRIDAAFTSGDTTMLLEAIHKLNGAATYCGVPALKAAAHQCETTLKQGEHRLYISLHGELLNEIDRVLNGVGNNHFN